LPMLHPGEGRGPAPDQELQQETRPTAGFLFPACRHAHSARLCQCFTPAFRRIQDRLGLPNGATRYLVFS
jgi:hypothetical protein